MKVIISKSIVQKMMSSENPVVLGFYIFNESNEAVGGHAVVGYDISFDPTFNAYYINIYDCSKGNGERIHW